MSINSGVKCIECGADIFRWYDIKECDDCMARNKRRAAEKASVETPKRYARGYTLRSK